jgi:hypothetical protein
MRKSFVILVALFVMRTGRVIPGNKRVPKEPGVQRGKGI